MKKNKIAILLATLTSLSAPAYSLEQLSAFATNANIDVNSVNYINLSESRIKQLKADNASLPEYGEIVNRVLGRGEIFLFDFSSNQGAPGVEIAKAEFRKRVSPLSFQENAVIVSRYNGKIMLTPVDIDKADEFVDILHGVEQESILSDVAPEADISNQGDFSQQVPMIEQYLNFQARPIDCTMKDFNSLGNLCPDSNMDLKYLVSMASSKSNGLTNNAKFLRITFGDRAQGAGVTLQNQMKTVHRETVKEKTVFVSSPFLDSAAFRVGAYASDKSKVVSIFNSYPDHINPNIKESEYVENTFTLTMALDPKSISGTSSISSKRGHQVTNETKEYEITKKLVKGQYGSPNAINEAQFTWKRKAYINARDHMKWYNNVIQRPEDPLKFDNISTMAYQSFMPKFDVTFVNEAKGNSGMGYFYIYNDIITTSVLANAKYYCSMYGCNTTYAGDMISSPEFKTIRHISIDWDHPIFVGQWPVNLQLAGADSTCLSLNESATPKILVVTCSFTEDNKQGFFLDPQGRYQSLTKPGYCLQRLSEEESKADVSIDRCNDNATLRQHWKWDGEKLINKRFDEQLFVNRENKELILLGKKPDDSFMPVAHSRFLDLFNSI